MGGKTLLGILGVSACLLSSNNLLAEEYIYQGVTQVPIRSQIPPSQGESRPNSYAVIPKRDYFFRGKKSEYKSKRYKF